MLKIRFSRLDKMGANLSPGDQVKESSEPPVDYAVNTKIVRVFDIGDGRLSLSISIPIAGENLGAAKVKERSILFPPNWQANQAKAVMF